MAWFGRSAGGGELVGGGLSIQGWEGQGLKIVWSVFGGRVGRVQPQNWDKRLGFPAPGLCPGCVQMFTRLG